MNNLRVKKDNIYRIEVNDDGEYIEFDLQDVSLNIKYYNALEEINSLMEETNKKQKELNERKAEAIEYLKLEDDTFKKSREIMDSFLGLNACQKIFGNRNYYDMFYDLVDELEKKRDDLNGNSHLDMLKINSANLRNSIIQKYGIEKKNVI